MTEKEEVLELEVRRFKISDLDRVSSIEKDSFPTPWSKSMFRNMHNNNQAGFKVAVLGSEVVGYVIYRVELSVNPSEIGYEKIGHLLNLAVKKGYRRRNIGSSLLKETEEYFGREGADEVWLEAREGNQAAREFYLKKGFKDMGVRRAYYPDGTNAIIMRKKIET